LQQHELRLDLDVEAAGSLEQAHQLELLPAERLHSELDY
jgi:hypothetical protein